MEQSKQIKWNGKITVVSVLWLIAATVLHGVWSVVISAFCLCFLIWSGWRERKYSFSIILLSILCILTVVSGVVFVIDHAAPTQLLEPLCEKMIASPSEYQVIDRQQQDITERFLQEISEQKDEEALRKMIVDEVSFISWTDQEEKTLDGDRTETRFVSKFYHLGKTATETPKYYEMITSVRSSFIRDNQTGKILEYENGAMSEEDSYIKGGQKIHANGFSNDAHLSEDKKSISFSESFYVELSDKRKQGTCEAKVEF